MLEYVFNLFPCFLQLDRAELVDELMYWGRIILNINFKFMPHKDKGKFWQWILWKYALEFFESAF